MSALTAVELVLALSFFAFVAVRVGLRRALGCDPRLDWLFIPGFFGSSCALGFYPYLVAAPRGVLFILLAYRYALRSTPVAGAVLFLADLLLFFSHGLVMAFAGAVAVTYARVGLHAEGTAANGVVGYSGWNINFFAFSETPVPAGYFPTDGCKPVLAKSSGAWSVLENVNCRTDAISRP